MRYALFSDIHANQPALEAVLADISSRTNVDAVYHLGDLMGYAPWPNEVVQMIQSAGIPGVAGNYDSTVATDYKNCGCKYEDPLQEELAHVSYEWTRANVSPSVKAFLAALPFRIDIRPLGGHVSGPRVVLLHAHTSNNLIYVTEDRPDAFLVKMTQTAGLNAGDVIAFGHTHRPWHRVVEGVHFVNTGSVGRPKDGDWRAGYVVLEVGEGEPSVDSVRVEYDVEVAARGIEGAGLSEAFADFLRTGGHPAPMTPGRA